ncbi:phage baseplate assembly protein V [Thauera phenylacetica]|uniref:phage baseplate assembly protein V n=1 Tax=Thauera phenylacetica TaxID=164400 RepID=UPI0039E3A9AA
MSDRIFARLIAPYARRLGNMLARGAVSVVNAASKMQTLQVKLMADEVKDGVEHFEPYGYTSHPKPGAEAIAAFFDGDRSHGAILIVGDRRFRLTGLAEGEVALYDDLGQKVHLTRTGIVIDGAGLPITITDTSKVRIESPMLECTGEIKDLCDTTGETMSGMRATYDGHTHPGDSGGTTGTPNQGM